MSAATDKLVAKPGSLDATADALISLAGADLGFATIAEQLPLRVVVLDKALRIRWLNKRAATSLGLKPDSAIGTHWPDLAQGPADRFDIYARVLAGESVDVKGTPIERDGQVVHVDGLCRPLRGPDGQIVGLLIIGQNVTQQRAAELALEQSEKRFRLLAEQSSDIVAMVSMTGRILYVNGAVERILGHARDQVIGRSGFDLIHPDDLARVASRLDVVTREGEGREVVPLEYRVRHRNGSWRWLESMPAILSDGPDGRTILTATRDVTERRRAEDALRLSEQRYRLAIHAMGGVIYEWDLATDRVVRTAGLGRWLRIAEDDLPDTIDAWIERVHPDDRHTVEEIRTRLERDHELEMSYRIRSADGDYARLWERSMLVPEADGGPRRAVGFILNRTDASRTQSLLEATERTAAIGGWEQNFRTNEIYWSRQVFKLFDLEPDTNLTVPDEPEQFFAPSAVARLTEAMDAARTRGVPFDLETRMVSAAGRIWWARVAAEVERDADGRPVRAYGAIQDITDRKRAEIELTTKTNWLEISLSTAQMSAWRLDLVSGEIHTAARSTNLGQMAIAPRTIDDLFAVMHPADRAGVNDAMERARRSCGTFETEYRTRMSDGRWAWKHSFGRMELDEQGRSTALIGATQDITDRRRAEAALRASERMLRLVTQHSTDSLTLVDRALRVQFVNRAVPDTSTSNMEGRPLADFLPVERVGEVHSCLRRVLATGHPDRYSLEYTTADGTSKHYEFRASPIMDRGDITGLVINGSEVTDHILAERAIATQARMIDSMLEGVAVIDAASRIEITNPAFDRMFGHSRGALIGMDIGVLSTVDELSALMRGERAQRQSADGSVPIEFEARRQDGSMLTVAGLVTRFEIAGGNHRLIVLQDVSERKALEREILEATSREQERIGADLHDGLGQELTGVALMLKSVAGRLGAEHPELLSEIGGITRLISEAVESTRSLARGLSPVSLERRGLVDALEGLAMRARDAYRIEVTFQHRVRAGVLLGQSLSDHLYRIAQEALANAMRHGEARAVAIRLTTHGARIRLQVVDDGAGLPTAALDAPGLGLKIMRYRARMVGGEVRFERNGRRGTRVICECPVPAGAAPTRQSARTRRKPANDNKGTQLNGSETT